MRAWRLHDTVGPDGYHLDDIDPPEPGPGQVRVALRVASINHLDLWVSRALPAPPSFPHIAGGDGAGVIDALGDGVTTVAVGDEVTIDPSLSCGVCPACLAGDSVYCPSFGVLGEHASGTLAEQIVVSERQVVPRPPIAWEKAGSYGLAFGTAYRMLRRADLRAGQTLLVIGTGGGVSTAAFQIGRALGADVMMTSRSDDKLAWAMANGAIAAARSDGAFSKELPTKAHVVVESVGPATFDQSMRSVRAGGCITVCGSTSGPKVEITVPVLFFKQVAILGSTMFDHAEFAEVTRLVATGRADPVVDTVYEFDQLPEALARMDAGEQIGKLALRVGDAPTTT